MAQQGKGIRSIDRGASEKEGRTAAGNAGRGDQAKRVRFALAFMLACSGLYALLQALPGTITGLVNEHTARTIGLVLNVFGIPAVTAADTVF